MANPQKENGHLDLANEIIEEFYALQLSGNEWRVLWVILRQTYGWNKTADRISISQFVQKTKLKSRHVCRALKDMVERKIVTKNDTTYISTYGFQKDYSLWKPSPKMTLPQTLTKNDTTPSPKMTLKPSPKLVNTKTNKPIYKYQGANDPKFDAFYKSYPKKKARRDAEKAWSKLNPDESLFNSIMASLERQKASQDWKKECGQYIPLPATWINGRRWEDEDQEVKPTW
jgi:phage replication O-like protein O